jgi:hypothetical protein
VNKGVGVALVFGAPVSRPQFEELACRERYWDYGQMMQAGRTTWADKFDAHYAPAAAVMSELCELASEHEFTVFQRATLSDLVKACAAHAIVIVAAHWKSSHVFETDLLPGWEDAFLALLQGRGNPLAVLLADRLGEAAPERHLVRDELNALIRSHRLRPHMPGGLAASVETSTLILEAISREMIDLAFADRIRWGNCLELYDGLHNALQIKEAIGDAMPAVLDLSCCTSSVLATYLRERDEQHVIAGDALVIPAPHLRMVHWVLTNYGVDPEVYVELRLAVARALRDMHLNGEVTTTTSCTNEHSEKENSNDLD